MDSQIQIRSKRKAFLNFILKHFFSEYGRLESEKKKKYGIQKLQKALSLNNIEEFRRYLTHKAPLLILNSKIHSDVQPFYFDELDLLLLYATTEQRIFNGVGQQRNFNGVGYFKNLFKDQKNKLERHYLEIIGKQLSRIPEFQQVQQNNQQQYYGKKYYLKLINFIMQRDNINDQKEAKTTLITYIDNKIENDQKKKEYVKNIINKLKTQ